MTEQPPGRIGNILLWLGAAICLAMWIAALIAVLVGSAHPK